VTPATTKSESGRSTTPTAPASKPTQVSTPWGPAALVEELRLPQQAGDRRFASLVQLLELPKGESLVRFAYATDGVARRGPVTLRERDLKRLHDLLEQQPRLKATLGL
jgi:hypothetical protein